MKEGRDANMYTDHLTISGGREITFIIVPE